MSHFRSSFLGMLLLSSTVLATACGPIPEADDAPATTQAALEDDSAAKPPKCNVRPGSYYVSRDPVECLTITFNCNAGEEQFFNDCGCGCTPVP